MIYCRISRDRVGAGLGVERQEKDCRALAKRLGLTVTQVLIDNDLSAYSNRKRRPGYQQLLEAVKSGTFAAIIAWHPDRLHRSPAELEGFIDVVDAARIPVYTCTAGDLDLSTASGRMTARIVGAVARHESEHKSERIRLKHLELAEKGLPSGGSRRYGFELDGVTVRTDEAEIIREMHDRVLSGDSLNGIAVDFNRRGVPSARGGPWRAVMVRQVILRPRNAGLRARKGEVVAKAVWQPLVTEETWRAACRIIADPARRTITTNARKHLLAGIARCGICDGLMRVTANHLGRQMYQCCGPHNCVSRDRAHLDALVIGAVIERLSVPGVVRDRQVARPRAFDVESATLRGRLKDAAKLFARGAIDAATLEDIKADIDGQMEALAAASVAALPSAAADLTGTVDQVRARWAEMSLERRRAVVDELYEIRVLRSRKGRGFDPASVVLIPR